MFAGIVPSIASAQAPGAGGRLDSAVFVTRLGADTLVIERVIRSPRRVEAEVAMRVPRTTRTVYVLELSPSGSLERMESLTSRSTARHEGCAEVSHAHTLPVVFPLCRTESHDHAAVAQ